jgi:hypothetical protein
MNPAEIENVFASEIYPSYPFRNNLWLAIPFERDAYDGARMPEWFFRAAQKHFNPAGTGSLFIKGDCFVQDGHSEVSRVDFEWEPYRSFMLSKEGFSMEYKVVSDAGECGFWADPESTIFGGDAAKMHALLSEHGGRLAMLTRCNLELFGDSAGYDEMRAYVRNLLFPEERRSA